MGMFMSNEKGFTLVEVLIALLILSIALMAVIRTTSQYIYQTSYLQNKMIATWVGEEKLNEILAGVSKLPEAPNEISEAVTMLEKNFTVKSHLEETPNPHIKKINVDVLSAQSKRLVELVSYEYLSN